jgi:hypothetical protein
MFLANSESSVSDRIAAVLFCGQEADLLKMELPELAAKAGTVKSIRATRTAAIMRVLFMKTPPCVKMPTV